MTSVTEADAQKMRGATLVTAYRLGDCLAQVNTKTGIHLNIYHDKNRNGVNESVELTALVPIDGYIRFFDAIARWDGTKLVSLLPPTTGSGGYTQADMDAAEKKGWNAALDKVDAATKGVRR